MTRSVEVAALSAQPFVPETRSLRMLRDTADECRGCPLYGPATQTVFGSGRATARVLLVGEQPGDVEDQKGRPFVGPAGRILWQCVEAAGIPNSALYVTNAVKWKLAERDGEGGSDRPDIES